jgi:hypothetical protein
MRSLRLWSGSGGFNDGFDSGFGYG